MYWDKEKKTFGDIEVEVTGTDTSPTFTSRSMLIRHVKVTLPARLSAAMTTSAQFSPSLICFLLFSPSTEERESASETIPVPEVG